MKCEYCDNEIPNGSLRCPSCGATAKAAGTAAPGPSASAPVQVAIPGAAGAQITPGAAGVQVVINNVAQPTPYAPPPPIVYKKRIVFVALGILLGPFGVHNFYAGYAGRGVSQLLLSLILLATPISVLPVYLWVIGELLCVTVDSRDVQMV